MSKVLMSLVVRGRTKDWSFNFMGERKHLKDWREDGLDVVELENTIPEWVAELGLTKVWCFFQDIYNFKNPF